MDFTTGELIQAVVTVFAIGGGSAYIKSEIKHLTEQVKTLNGSIKTNANNIHEHELWHTKHIENFHTGRK